MPVGTGWSAEGRRARRFRARWPPSRSRRSWRARACGSGSPTRMRPRCSGWPVAAAAAPAPDGQRAPAGRRPGGSCPRVRVGPRGRRHRAAAGGSAAAAPARVSGRVAAESGASPQRAVATGRLAVDGRGSAAEPRSSARRHRRRRPAAAPPEPEISGPVSSGDGRRSAGGGRAQAAARGRRRKNRRNRDGDPSARGWLPETSSASSLRRGLFRARVSREASRAWLLATTVRHDEGLFAREGFLAGPDDRRLDELRDAFGDPEARAVVMARGGYGLARLLPFLDPACCRRSRFRWSGSPTARPCWPTRAARA